MIDAHRGAFEYDWRTRFHLPLTVIGESMSWGEAIRLTQILTADPGSQVLAAAAGWQHPVSREWLLLADLFDLGVKFGGVKNPEPYPRPQPQTKSKRTGPDPSLTQDDVIAALRSAGHTAPIPVKP